MKYVILLMFVFCFGCAKNEKPFSMITYNVLADNENREIRIKKMVEILESYDATVICLQEVSQDILNDFNKYGLLKKYHFSNHQLSSHRGLCILSKLPIEEFYSQLLPSRQGRALHDIDILYQGVKIRIATCHLESPLRDHQVRVLQMKEFFKRFQGKDHVFFVGDFNFGEADILEENEIKAVLSDTWKMIHPNELGYTWNMENNQMAKKGSFPGEKSRRIDRIFYYGAGIKPKLIQIIGVDAIKENLYPSDHYGLYAEFEIK